MKLFKARLDYGRAVVVADSLIDAAKLLNNHEFIIGEIPLTDIEVVEPYSVIGGEPSVIEWYQE